MSIAQVDFPEPATERLLRLATAEKRTKSQKGGSVKLPPFHILDKSQTRSTKSPSKSKFQN